MFEGFLSRKKPERPEGDADEKSVSAKLAELESRRDALIEWMKRDSTPDDVRVLDNLNRQIQELQNGGQ